jgi:hypothetical protein
MFQKYQLLSESDLVPKSVGGLYFFKLRFPSDFELGIEWGSETQVDIAKLIRVANRYYLHAFDLAGSAQLEGDLREVERAAHLQSYFKVAAKRRVPDEALALVEQNLKQASKDQHQLRATLRATRAFFDQLPPAYVGMCSRQSLFDRLTQHTAGTTGFANRIRDTGLGWNDLQFYAFPLEEFSSTDTRLLEKLFQSLIRPSLSIA